MLCMQCLLLIRQVTQLSLPSAVVVDVCLPSRHTTQEQLLHLFKRLPARLGEHEENVDRHGCAEYTKDDVYFPLNVNKCRWYEVAEGKVEDPIRRSGDGDSLSTHTQREKLRGINPRDRTPGGCVRCDEEIGACDDGFGRGTTNFPGLLGNIVETARWSLVAIGCHQTGVGKHPSGHEKGAYDERNAAAPAIDEDESKDGHEDVDDILNRRGDEIVVTLETSHTEDVRDLLVVSPTDDTNGNAGRRLT